MGYKKFFKEHSLNEISERTHISPIKLSYIIEGKFENIKRNKFLAFVQIIEREYDVDLSDLKDEYNEIVIEEEKLENPLLETIEDEGNKKSYFLIFILIIFIFTTLFYMQKKQKEEYKVLEVNESKVEENLSNKILYEFNDSDENKSQEEVEDKNESVVVDEKIIETYKIIPNYKLWCKVRYLDDNSTKEFLTSNPFEVNATRDEYLKCGHGEFLIVFGDKNITPNTKKIVRYLFKDGNFSITKKIMDYE